MAPNRRTWRWRRGRVLASLGISAAAFSASTMALLTGSATVDGNAFTVGSVNLAAAPATALFTVPAMAPGDTVTAPLQISNTGTLQLRYAMTGSATGDATLASTITVAVRSGVADCSNAGFAGSGTQVASGTISAVALGNPAQGSHAGDRVLDGGTNETLCFQAALPITAGSSVQGKSSTATFAFAAEQTANN